ncbi:MAG: DUF898 family protein [Myxococcales bacterium]|nr:YjgN family protein [Polyangiaceae bacterium]MDW8250950.1 DUF898 family protein [Myxococcales bacterium]
MGSGSRVVFTGEGGQLFKLYFLNAILPIMATYLVGGGIAFVGSFLGQQIRGDVGSLLPGLAGVVGGLVVLIGAIVTTVLFLHKFQVFYYQNLKLDGQNCEYRGDLQSLAIKAFINLLLTYLTLGIYGPWMMCNLKKHIYENTAVNGQMGRLVFEGKPTELLGKYIVGMILTYCTFGIYVFWFANDIFAFMWENTKLDGRPFQFRRDPGGLFGTLILNYLLTYCTLGLYTPWMMCNLFKWEAEHVS